MLAGSIGMLPSASLDADNKGLYEPIHGSAPDIAGQDMANPLATILSLAMMFRYTFARADVADRIETRGAHACSPRACAPATSRCRASATIGTRAMGDAVVGGAVDEHDPTRLQQARRDDDHASRFRRLARYGGLGPDAADAARSATSSSSSRCSSRRRRSAARARRSARTRRRSRTRATSRRSKALDVDRHLPGRRLHERRLPAAARRGLEGLLDRRRVARCA